MEKWLVLGLGHLGTSKSKEVLLKKKKGGRHSKGIQEKTRSFQWVKLKKCEQNNVGVLPRE